MRAPALALALLAQAACGRESAPGREARDTAQPAARSAQSDSVLVAWIEWHRDWMRRTNRHKAELDADSARLAATYSHAESHRVAEDPELLAMLARQREEMQPLVARAPRGLTAEALEAAVRGVGRVVIGPRAITFVPGRDEAALDSARAAYGDEFVRWVLAHEQRIIATLAASR